MGMVEMRRFSIPPSGPPVFMACKEGGHSNHHSSKPRGWVFLPWVISSYQLMDFCRKLALVVLSAILVASIVSLPPVWNSLGSIIKLHGWIAFFQDDNTRVFNEYQDLKNDHGLLHLQLTDKNKYIQNLQHINRILGQENRPYLCRKDGIFLRCPQVKEPPSLWENPYSATTSWKPCAQRHEKNFGHLPSENETNGYILIHAEGGLNQQRVAICNAVAVAKIINATLILPCLKQDQIWKDQTKFEDVFDVYHFIEYLKYDVPIVRDIPAWFPDKGELFTSIRRTVKNIPKYASADFYIDNVLPRIKEKKIMALKPFVDRLGYDNVPSEINRLRCRVNYHALKFLPDIENMAEILASRMRNRTGTSHPYMALHLRFEKGMVGLSFCDFVGSRSEKAMMAAYRQKEWPRRYKNGSHLWQMALEKRKEGRCPLEPGEVAVLLRAMGYPKETQIYVASGQVYGGQNRMAPLRNMFPNLVTKEELATTEELNPFRKHITSLAALDFLVCLKSDVFVMTHGGNFAKLIIGARRYMGHRLKSIKPNKGLMTRSLGDPFLGWTAFREDIVVSHETRTGLPEPTFPVYDIWENPLSHCMCKV